MELQQKENFVEKINYTLLFALFQNTEKEKKWNQIENNNFKTEKRI